MSGLLRHVAGGLLAVVCALVLGGCLLSGLAIAGKGGPDLQCLGTASFDQYEGPPMTEATQYRGEWTLAPIGLRCTYFVPTANGSAYRQAFEDWPATYTAWAALALGAVGLLLLVLPARGELGRLEQWLESLNP